MINATYFGEITELDSRALWYSDEEDEDEDELENPGLALKPRPRPIESLTHENLRANVQLNFRRIAPGSNLSYETCVVSLISSSQFKNFRISSQSDTNSCVLLGYFDVAGKAFSYPIKQGDHTENLLWLVFDSGSNLISGQEVCYFVEKLRDSLLKDFVISSTNPLLILSQQFSTSEHLEYLSNLSSKALSLPFNGRPLQPPALIRNQFESALFEQLSLITRPVVIICLPAPKNFWFDRDTNWPTVPMQIIGSRLTDDSLEKTLIFT